MAMYLGEDKVANGGFIGDYDSLPVGSILPFSSENPPIGYLICDGSEISRDSYKELFEVIGTSFGNGNGSTTFNLPNLNGKVPVGKSSTSDSVFNVGLGTVVGEEKHTLTIAEMPKHRHVIPYSANSNPGYNSVFRSIGSEGEGFSPYQGDSQPHNIVQPSLVVYYIIKASGTSILNGNVVDSLDENSTTNAPSQRVVKEGLDKVLEMNNPDILLDKKEVINITPLVGSNYEIYGNSYYYKKGSKVYLHMGLSGLTANTSKTVFVMPVGYRPYSRISISGQGSGYNTTCGGELKTDGTLILTSTSTYAVFSVEYDSFN